MSAVQEIAVLSPRARRRRRIRRRLLRRPMAVAGLVIAIMFVILAIFAPVIAPYPPGKSDFSAALAGPSSEHWFGTDDLGRDTLSRVIWGARASMQAGVLATVLAMAVAVPFGLMAGDYPGRGGPPISRVTHRLLALPFPLPPVRPAARARSAR